MPQEEIYKIEQAARIIGVDRNTIRRWELQGKIPFKVKRNNMGWRVFTAKEVETLKEVLIKLHPPM